MEGCQKRVCGGGIVGVADLRMLKGKGKKESLLPHPSPRKREEEEGMGVGPESTQGGGEDPEGGLLSLIPTTQ